MRDGGEEKWDSSWGGFCEVKKVSYVMVSAVLCMLMGMIQWRERCYRERWKGICTEEKPLNRGEGTGSRAHVERLAFDRRKWLRKQVGCGFTNETWGSPFWWLLYCQGRAFPYGNTLASFFGGVTKQYATCFLSTCKKGVFRKSAVDMGENDSHSLFSPTWLLLSLLILSSPLVFQLLFIKYC